MSGVMCREIGLRKGPEIRFFRSQIQNKSQEVEEDL
jgi:hypothetical protein